MLKEWKFHVRGKANDDEKTRCLALFSEMHFVPFSIQPHRAVYVRFKGFMHYSFNSATSQRLSPHIQGAPVSFVGIENLNVKKTLTFLEI